MTQAEMQSDRSLLEAELVAYGAKITGNKILCPFHNDHNPSANVYEKDGVWRFKCHTCGAGPYDVFDVMAKAQNKPVDDILRETNEHIEQPARRERSIPLEEIEASMPGVREGKYQYVNPDTKKTDMIVYRLRMPDGSKSFRQISPNGQPGCFIPKGPPKPLPLYNRSRISMSKQVIVVEGEKCVHALHLAGIVATTSPGGAQNSSSADWSPLAGKEVYLWPDNDEPGHRYMDAVAAKLEEINPAPRVFRIDPTECGLGDKEDAADYLERIDEAERTVAVAEVCNEAQQVNVSRLDKLCSHFEKAISGVIRILPFMHTELDSLTNGLKPGTITLICGEPGSCKSLFLLDHLIFWHEQGIKTCVYELEENHTYHLNRVLAIKDNNSNLTSEREIFANPNDSRCAIERHRPLLESISKHIWEINDYKTNTTLMLEWVARRIEDGYELICIDPISARDPSGKPWVEDFELVTGIESLLDDTNSRVVLITHPKQGARTRTTGDLAGGAVFERFIQTIVWLYEPNKIKDLSVKSVFGTTSMCPNRIMKILKTRNGKGRGSEIAYDFSGETFTFIEQGIIQS